MDGIDGKITVKIKKTMGSYLIIS